MNELNLNVLIAIVAKAMKENFTITTNYDGITVTNNEGKYISLSLYTKGEYVDKNSIEINTDRGRNSIENISEEEILRFQLLIKDCERYEKSKLIEDINSFFATEEKKEETKKTINDLDNEDD